MKNTELDNDKWTIDSMLEVKLLEQDNFLKIRETLTRIGIASRTSNTLWQSCHILHKQGRYYIVHFLELFALDGKRTSLTHVDILRRNRIAHLLAEWNLLEIVDINRVTEMAPISQIKIVPFKDKANWVLVQKYSIGLNKYYKQTEKRT